MSIKIWTRIAAKVFMKSRNIDFHLIFSFCTCKKKYVNAQTEWLLDATAIIMYGSEGLQSIEDICSDI